MGVMEVAAALLDASRRLSSGSVSSRDSAETTNKASASSDWMSDSTSHGKNDNTSQHSSWLGDWVGRPRTMSEGDRPKVKMDLVAWVAGFSGTAWGQHQSTGMTLDPNRRMRRKSSKDVEEAMAGGLSKADLYMPPM